ncbi:MAG: L,D-transpeptidase family protein [Actinomycetota bacterium]
MEDTGIATGGRSGWRRFIRFPSGRALLISFFVISGLLFVLAAGVSFAGYQMGERYEGRILPGSEIAGVDVSGMNEERAIDAVKGALGPQLDRVVTVTYGGQSWTITPRELGARSDARRVVRAALEASDSASLFKLMRMSVLGADLGFEREIAITYPRQGIRGFVKGLSESFDREPRDQGIDYSSGWVEFLEPRAGRSIKQGATRAALPAALEDGSDEVPLAVKTVAPKVTDRYDKVLLVRIGENRLYLYERGKIVREWPVATGLPEYPTPTGEYEVTLKRYMPTWVNPAPDTWGASMPDSIPPGPGNPLGLRAINWDAPAIRFHGTTATYSLGYNASHGCVRMANEDVIELYDMIEVGTPIVSVEVAPYRPLYGSSTLVDATTTQTAEPEADDGPAQADEKDKGKGSGDR